LGKVHTVCEMENVEPGNMQKMTRGGIW